MAQEVKQWEQSKVTRIATASRNLICARYAKERETKAGEIAAATKRLQKLHKTTSTAMAWREDRPVGIRFESNARANPLGSGRERTSSVGHKRARCPSAPIAIGPNAPSWVGAPADKLAGLAVERDGLIRDAQAEVDRLMASGGGVPITRLQWAAWLDDNLAEFKQLLPTAHIRRRAGNTRIRARPELPPRAHRIQAQAVTGMLQTVWAKRLAGRIGWHGMRTTTEKKMFFLACHGRCGQRFVRRLRPHPSHARVSHHGASAY